MKDFILRTCVFYTFCQFHLSSLYHSNDVGLQHELWSLPLRYFLWSTKDVNKFNIHGSVHRSMTS